MLSPISKALRIVARGISEEHKHVIEKKPIRILDQADMLLEVPITRQSNTCTCGPASLLSVLGYYGYNPREKEVVDALGTTLEGDEPDDFMKGAQRFGLKCKFQPDMTFEDLKKYLDKKTPVILSLQAWGEKKDYTDDWKDGHYNVAIGYDKKGFYLMDPSQLGYSYSSLKDLDSRWHDTDGHRNKVYHLGIIIYGKSPKFDYEKVKSIEC
jgi:ABC-type bacteriocin/lantibiotic exporter with double-glycine peptidase domain